MVGNFGAATLLVTVLVKLTILAEKNQKAVFGPLFVAFLQHNGCNLRSRS